MADPLDLFAQKNVPVPSIYYTEKDAADSAYQAALNQLAQKQSLLANQFGFKIHTDPSTGALLDTQIDPNNQFSSVMNLMGSHAAGLRNLREQLAGAGLAGGGLKGLAAQRAALLRFQQQGQLASLGSNFAGQFGDLTNQRAGAGATRDAAYNQAASDAINFAIQNGLFNTVAPAPAAAAPSGGGGAPAPSDPTAGNPQTYAPVDTGGGGLMGAASGLASMPFTSGQIQAAQSPSQIQQASNMLAGFAPVASAPSSPSGAGAVKAGTSTKNAQAARNSF